MNFKLLKIASLALLVLACGQTAQAMKRPKEELNKALLKATQNNDGAEVIRLINAGAYINCTDSMGSAPLIWASFIGSVELAKLLIDHGADVNTQNDHQTPLHLACWRNSLELAKLFINHGANVNCKKIGETPLHLTSHPELAQLLINHGADINCKDSDGKTPLDQACFDNNVELAKLLINHDANINLQSNDGSYPLHFACSNNNIELAKLLINHGADINGKDNNDRTALSYAEEGYENTLIDTSNDRFQRIQLEHSRILGLLNNHRILPSLDVTILSLIKRK